MKNSKFLTSIPYLDYAASTPLDPRIKETICHYLDNEDIFANPASSHTCGQQAALAVSRAREQVAHLINAHPKEIIFTSGATESNNLALKGAAFFYESKGKHIISCQTEHKSILDPLQYLKTQGFEITLLTVDKTGRINLSDLENSIRPDTILLSFMHVNNETGTIHDIDAIAKIAKKHHVRLHVDAAQSAGKLTINVKETAIDLLSIASHKLYGPKGIGALYIRSQEPRTHLVPLFHGGNHERGYRAGTLPTHQIAAFGQACALSPLYHEAELPHLKTLSDRLINNLLAIEGSQFNANKSAHFPGIINISFNNVPGDPLLAALQTELCVSSGSACTSVTIDPSHVLLAMGLSHELAQASIRYSIGRFTTEKDLTIAIERTQFHVKHLQSSAMS
jgi:cysteine desulfurase